MKTSILYSIVCCTLILASCNFQEKLCDEGKCFNLNNFEDNLNNYLDSTTTGYVYSVFSDGQLQRWGEKGYAAIPKDGGEMLNSHQTSINIASAAKTLTTIALLQILDKKGLSTQEKLVDWIPSSWNVGSNINMITFEHLLTHKSGFRPTSPGESYNDIETEISNGIMMSDFDSPQYHNMNFCLFRIIIPILNGDVNKNNAIQNPIDYDQSLQDAYMAYLNTNVGGPYSATISCNNPGDILYYDFNAPNKSGLKLMDECHNTGAGAVSMTIIKLAQIMYETNFTTNLLSKDMQAVMFNKDKPLGCYVGDETPVNNGVHFRHNGGFTWNGQGTQACWYVFENGVACAIATNSANGIEQSTFGIIDNLIETAFDNAWE